MNIASYVYYGLLGIALGTTDINIGQTIAVLLTVMAIDINSFFRAYEDFENGR